MEIFYIGASRRPAGQITLDDLIVKVNNTGETRSNSVRGQTIVGGYTDWFQVNSIVYLNKDQLMAILSNIRYNVNSICDTLESYIQETPSTEEMVKNILDSGDHFDVKVSNIIRVVNSNNANLMMTNLFKSIARSCGENLNIGEKEVIISPQNAAQTTVRRRSTLSPTNEPGYTYVQRAAADIISELSGVTGIDPVDVANRVQQITGVDPVPVEFANDSPQEGF